MVKGMGKSFPIRTASPGCRLGKKSDAALSISPHARSIISLSRSLVSLWTISVPNWLSTPSVISLGRWVAKQIFRPNLRPSFAINSNESNWGWYLHYQ